MENAIENKSLFKRIFSSENAATDDYADRKVPENWSWGLWGVVVAVSAPTTSGFYFAFAPSLVAGYGFKNYIIGLIYIIILEMILGAVFVNIATKTRLGSDLATRGLGFGYLGSLITAFIWFVTWIWYFALETQIIGVGVAEYLRQSPQVWMAICGLLFIPLTIYGMVFMEKFQRWTIPVFVIWLVYAIYKVMDKYSVAVSGANPLAWSTYWNDGKPITLLSVLGCIAVFNGVLAALVVMFMDYARLLKPAETPGKRFWNTLAITALPVNFCLWIVISSIALMLYKYTGSLNPGEFFVLAAGGWGLLGLLVTQIRINMMNNYISSLMLANIITRIFHYTPGRAFWAAITCILGTVLCYGDMLQYITAIQVYLGIFLFAWVGIMLSDYAIVRAVMKIDIGPLEHRRAYLKKVNPVGMASFFTGVVVGFVLHFAGGPAASQGMQVIGSLASFIAFVISFAAHPIYVSIICKNNRYVYIHRDAEKVPDSVVEAGGTVKCAQCLVHADHDDVCRCPVNNFDWICSECCSNNSECNTKCQDSATTFPKISLAG